METQEIETQELTPTVVFIDKLWVHPSQLTPNEANSKARPAETPQGRRKRIEETKKSILQNGQEYPVLVIQLEGEDEFGNVRYEYIDGGVRVDSINELGFEHPEGNWHVWCWIVDADGDHYRTAVTANLHRSNPSILDMAGICQEVRERMNFKGRGAGEKVAEYLGILPSRVSEYTKVLRAPQLVKDKIASGEIGSLDAALKLMSEPEETREVVAKRATEIAKDEARTNRKAKKAPQAEEEAATQQSDGVEQETVSETVNGFQESLNDGFDQESALSPEFEQTFGIHGDPEPEPVEPAEPVKVKAKHVAQASREVGSAKQSRNRSQILAFFEQITEAAYAPATVKFVDAFVAWAGGEGATDKKIKRLFDEMLPDAVVAKKVKAKKVAVAVTTVAKKKAVKPVKATKGKNK